MKVIGHLKGEKQSYCQILCRLTAAAWDAIRAFRVLARQDCTIGAMKEIKVCPNKSGINVKQVLWDLQTVTLNKKTHRCWKGIYTYCYIVHQVQPSAQCNPLL